MLLLLLLVYGRRRRPERKSRNKKTKTKTKGFVHKQQKNQSASGEAMSRRRGREGGLIHVHIRRTFYIRYIYVTMDRNVLKKKKSVRCV